MMKYRNAFLLTLIFPLLVSPLVQGQGSSYKFSANLANPRIAVGDFGALELKAIGGEPENPPRSIDVPGLSITYTGSQFHQDHEVVQGRVTTTLTYTYYYTIQGAGAGDYTIPEISVNIRGETVTSNPVKVTIVKSAAPKITPTGSRFATLEVPKDKIYVNQIFPVDATIYVKGRNAINDMNAATLKQEGLVTKRFARFNLGTDELDGTVYSTAKLPTEMFALKEGDHRIGPATFNVKIYENTRFFAKIETRVVHSDSKRITVLPLPQGAPFGFSGGVGAFEMDMKATPTKLKVGDPVSLDFTITGEGNFQTLGAPFMKNPDPEVWKVYEPKKSLEVITDEGDWVAPSNDVFAQRALFSQVLIPLQEVEEIPSFELNFFDPEVGQYVRRTTVPIPVSISPDSNSGFSNAIDISPAPVAGVPAMDVAVPSAQFPDILHIRKDEPGWRTYSATGRPDVIFNLVNGLFGAALVAFIGVSVVRKIRLKRLAANSGDKTTTFREALNRVKPGMDREDFFHAALDAFSVWEQENPNAKQEIRSVVAGFKNKCESALYSNSNDPGNAVVKSTEASEFLKVLKKLPA